MKTRLLLPLLALLIISCNNSNNKISLAEGSYVLAGIDSKEESTNTDLGFVAMELVVKNDSILFPGFRSLGPELFNNSKFKYELYGDELTLYDKNSKESYDFEITSDSLLKIEIDNKRFKNVYFKKYKINLSGKYRIASLTRSPTSNWEELDSLKFKPFLLEKPAFNFINKDQAIINTKLLQYVLNKEKVKDSLYNYSIDNDSLYFSNTKNTLSYLYTYNHTLNLYLNDKYFQKLDLFNKNQEKQSFIVKH